MTSNMKKDININTPFLARRSFLSGTKVGNKEDEEEERNGEEEEEKTAQPRKRLAWSSKACWVGNHSFIVLLQ